MKPKLLLTICLLLITSQVFAKEVTFYVCESEAEAKLCNSCKKNGWKIGIKANENKNIVLLQTIDDSGEVIQTRYLQTVKDENKWIAENTKFAYRRDVVKNLDLFDENNWEYLYNSRIIHASPYNVKQMSKRKISMVNGKYRSSWIDQSQLSSPQFYCGK